MQAMVESLLSEYPNVLVLRVRMPIVGDLLYPRNFITKIIKYEKVLTCHSAGFAASGERNLVKLGMACAGCVNFGSTVTLTKRT